jgi:hypothetical protein
MPQERRSGRLIPMHKDLREAMIDWRGMAPATGPVVRSERGGRDDVAKHRRLVRSGISSRRP